MVTFLLLVVGGVNWGLVGLGAFMGGNWNVVNLLLGSWPMLEYLVYVLVGVAAVYELAMHKKTCRACTAGGSAPANAGM